MPKLQKKTFVFIIIYVSLFSSVYVLTKMIIPPLNAFTYLFLRSIIGSLFLCILLAFQGRLKTLIEIIQYDGKSFLVLGILLTFSLICAFLATDLTSPSNQSLILNLTTIIIILLNFIFYGIIPKKIIGISALITLVGILLLMYPLNSSENSSITGDVLMMTSTIFDALYTIKMGIIAKKYPSPQISFILAILISFFTMPFFFILNGPAQLRTLDLSQIIILLLLGFGITGVLYTLLAKIMADPTMTSNILAIIITIIPILGTILGVIVYGDSLSKINILGAFLVLLGVFIINFKKEEI